MNIATLSIIDFKVPHSPLKLEMLLVHSVIYLVNSIYEFSCVEVHEEMLDHMWTLSQR